MNSDHTASPSRVSWRGVLISLLALTALLVCGSLLHTGSGHENPTVSAAEQPGVGIDALTHGTVNDLASPPDQEQHHGCAGHCGEPVLTALTCIFMLLTVGLLFLTLLRRGVRMRVREWLLLVIAPIRSGLRRITPTPQELSISRT